jgi:hypothetical protein
MGTLMSTRIEAIEADYERERERGSKRGCEREIEGREAGTTVVADAFVYLEVVV